MNNSIPVCRSIQEHWIYKDAEYFKIWFEMLANARYINEPKTDMYEKIVYTINRGEFIFGRISWSKRLNIGEQKIRTFIKKLIKEDMLREIRKTSKFTIYYITNYDKFNQQNNQQQDLETTGIQDYDNQQDNQHLTSKQPSSNHHLTTNEESKEGCKKGKKDKNVNIIDEFTSNTELKEAIKDFMTMRNKIKKPMTDRALKLLFKDLDKYGTNDQEKIEIINQSIVNCWQGVFPLKNKNTARMEGKNASNKRDIEQELREQGIGLS